MTSWKCLSIGAPPDADNDALQWAKSVGESPMPIKGRFIPWENFVLKFKDGNTMFTD